MPFDVLWQHRVSLIHRLSDGIESLRASIGNAQRVTESEWYGALRNKLIPQCTVEPFLIIAICGGTNIGKSAIVNHLADSQVSRSHPLATRTRHPVCCIPFGFAERNNLADFFPGFTLLPWTSPDDPLRECDESLLFYRVEESGRQPATLLLLDTPDLDGVYVENRERAAAIRRIADVLVIVLTGQKYNDAAVRDFFRQSSRADQVCLVIFNQVHWPVQEAVVKLWLDEFCQQTGCRPYAAYAAPFDAQAAESLTLPFYPLSAGVDHPRRDLAELRFAEIKWQTLAGSLQQVLNPQDGLPAELRRWEARVAAYRSAGERLIRELKLHAELPAPPRQILWNEFHDWFHRRRFPLVQTVYQAVTKPYSWLGNKWRSWRGAPDPTVIEEQTYRQAEWDAVRRSLELLLDRVDRLRNGNDPILIELLADAAPVEKRSELFTKLQLHYDRLPLITADYQSFIREELDRFATEHPKVAGLLDYGLLTLAAARPAITIGLGWAGGGGADILVGTVIDNVVGGALVGIGGDTLLSPPVKQGLQKFLGGIFKRFHDNRTQLLCDCLHDLILGPALERVRSQASLTESSAWRQVQSALKELQALSPVPAND